MDFNSNQLVVWFDIGHYLNIRYFLKILVTAIHKYKYLAKPVNIYFIKFT